MKDRGEKGKVPGTTLGDLLKPGQVQKLRQTVAAGNREAFKEAVISLGKALGFAPQFSDAGKRLVIELAAPKERHGLLIGKKGATIRSISELIFFYALNHGTYIEKHIKVVNGQANAPDTSITPVMFLETVLHGLKREGTVEIDGTKQTLLPVKVTAKGEQGPVPAAVITGAMKLYAWERKLQFPERVEFTGFVISAKKT